MTFPTFPARPINCGKLPIARKKFGVWEAEPKISGQRVTLHVPTGAMWNRHGEKLARPEWFAKAAAKLKELLPNAIWLDCEGLYQAHHVGKGTLVVLDVMDSANVIEDRRKQFECLPEFPLSNDIPQDSVFKIPHWPWERSMELWNRLQSLASEWLKSGKGNVPLYEGIVAKRVASPYPFQLRDSKHEFSGWAKHRFDR